MERTLDFVQTTGAKIHTVWIYFLYPIYSLNHPDTAKQLLKSTAPKGSGSGYLLLKPWIGKPVNYIPINDTTLELSVSGHLIQKAGSTN